MDNTITLTDDEQAAADWAAQDATTASPDSPVTAADLMLTQLRTSGWFDMLRRDHEAAVKETKLAALEAADDAVTVGDLRAAVSEAIASATPIETVLKSTPPSIEPTPLPPVEETPQ